MTALKEISIQQAVDIARKAAGVAGVDVDQGVLEGFVHSLAAVDIDMRSCNDPSFSSALPGDLSPATANNLRRDALRCQRQSLQSMPRMPSISLGDLNGSRAVQSSIDEKARQAIVSALLAVMDPPLPEKLALK